MHTALLRFLFVGLLVFSCSASATTPEEVAEQYLEVATNEGLSQTGRFFEPEAVQGMKDTFVSLLELEAEQGQSQVLQLMFGEEATLDAARAMPPAEFYGGVMRFIEAQMQSGDIRFSDSAVLGAVREGDDVAHVVTRVVVGVGAQSVSSVDLISMRKEGDGWTLLMQPEMDQFASAIGHQVERARASAPPVPPAPPAPSTP